MIMDRFTAVIFILTLLVCIICNLWGFYEMLILRDRVRKLTVRIKNLEEFVKKPPKFKPGITVSNQISRTIPNRRRHGQTR